MHAMGAAISAVATPATIAVEPSTTQRLAQLTARETQVLRLIARGGSNGELAAALVVSEATVKTHVSKVLAKLGLCDRVQAVIAAYAMRPCERRRLDQPIPAPPCPLMNRRV